MNMLIEYLEYRAWWKREGGNLWFAGDEIPDYKGFLDAYADEPRPEGFWRD